MIDPSQIEHIAVYPPVGIARVGNAEEPDGFFFASEVIGGVPDPGPGGFRGAGGRIKRQGVKFRLYARMRDGGIREITAEDVTRIEWRVEVANLKAGWYEFNEAMDLPDHLAKPANRRNDGEPHRARLDIRPGQVAITGRDAGGPGHRFADGEFFEKPVYLGELRTDAAGRLIFLGGIGNSAPAVAGTPPTTFANNKGWHDDVADGPVRATVIIGATRIEATAGYVVVAPPNYAPGLFGVVTMDDVVRETFHAAGWLARPDRTSFASDVWPIFDRLTGMGWVNHGLFVAHGFGSPLDARDDGAVGRMRDRSGAARGFRQAVLALFRDPAATAGEVDWLKLPVLYGDAFGEGNPPDRHARTLLCVTPMMFTHLQRWATGDFIDDWAGVPQPPRFAELKPVDQMAQLERAALYECLGGPFHPGIELTWVMRQPRLWTSPYRLKLLPEGASVRQDYGSMLTPQACLAPDGPVASGAGPGALTRWLGVPWQTDEASCNSSADYAPSTYLSMPSYWGARVPDQVLSANAWARAQDAVAGEVQRLKHFFHREDWLRDVRGRTYQERIATMVTRWWRLGTVLPQAAPEAMVGKRYPAVVHSESGRHPDAAGSDEKVRLVALIEHLAAPVSAAPLAGTPAPAAPRPAHVPPQRRFRQGEV